MSSWIAGRRVRLTWKNAPGDTRRRSPAWRTQTSRFPHRGRMGPLITCGPELGFRWSEIPSTAEQARLRASRGRGGASRARRTSVRCWCPGSLPQRRSRCRSSRGIPLVPVRSPRIRRVVSKSSGTRTRQSGASTILPRSRAKVTEPSSSTAREADRHLGAVAIPGQERRRQTGQELDAAKPAVAPERLRQGVVLATQLLAVVHVEVRAGAAFLTVRTADSGHR